VTADSPGGDFLVVLDACVLVQAPLRDTLLRLAEPPRLYVHQWSYLHGRSEDITTETVRTLERRIGLAPEKTAYLVGELRSHFADAWVTGHELFIDRMTNDPKDRHVVAAAVKCGAQAIVTYNLRHFPVSSVEPWGIECKPRARFSAVNMIRARPWSSTSFIHRPGILDELCRNNWRC
jgi:hypothetical protein